MSMESLPLVSIILPTYNRAHVLSGAIQSVLQQTYTNFELIIVDDNSPDNTLEVVQSFADKRLKYVKNEANLKLPGTLNKGFSISRGDFLTWTSDDNFFAEQAIEKMVAVLQQKTCDFVYADYDEFSKMDSEHNEPQDSRRVKLPDKLTLKKGNQVGACFMYTRKAYETVGDYDTELFLVEDYDYWIRIAALFQVCHISEALYFFRRDDQTLYCSRFCEVKVSDFLVRYKNNLLDKNEMLAVLSGLIENNIERLNHYFHRMIFNILKKTSFRLTGLYQNWLVNSIKVKMRSKVNGILTAFDDEQISFKQAKKELMALLNSIAKIEYQ